ncbi:MAG TPA: SGNH/GDSL hydrolase family protein [Myxococcota bacterium]|nr:SGNH/GDSL hydrolase family protein [Myxococcota bacterium]
MPGKRTREILLLVLVSTAMCLVAGELVLRAYLSRHTFYDVEMSRYARLLKVDSENPKIGYVHRPNREEHLMNVDVRINSDGFRDDEYPLEKGARWRIIFLGDSLTFGWGVEKDQTFEALLERALQAKRPTEIINFGAGNYNTEQEVNLFLEKGLRYRPDQVVLFYFINDAEPTPRASRLEWLGNFRIATFYWSRVKALWARFDPSTGFEAYYRDLYRDGAPGWQHAQEALLQLRDAAREHGIALQVVLLPELHAPAERLFAPQYARVMEFLRANGIPALDLSPRFAGETDPMSLWVAPDDAHPNARAHRAIADSSYDFIAEASPS